MQRRSRSSLLPLALVSAVCLVAAGCGDTASPGAEASGTAGTDSGGG